MPGGNGTGPKGNGPLTGRGAGFCAGYSVPGYLNASQGRGMRFGRGHGYGRMLWAVGLIPGCAYIAYRWTNRNRMKKASNERKE